MDEEVAFFNKNGYILIPDALTESECEELKNMIDTLDNKTKGDKKKQSRHQMHKVVFIQYPELCLRIFKNKRIHSLCKKIIGMCGSPRGSSDTSLKMHVIHNNTYCVQPGQRGQAPVWHTDDPPLFITTNEKNLPDNIIFAPTVLTCMYYLNDIRGPIDGMTHVIPGSHRFGRLCTKDDAESQNFIAPAVKKGTALIISSSVWHRGSNVAPEGRPRYVFQVSYGRRLVGHKHDTIMDFVMPNQVKNLLKTDEDKELMGYLQGGAYS